MRNTEQRNEMQLSLPGPLEGCYVKGFEKLTERNLSHLCKRRNLFGTK